jgi:DNA-binding XRE family transcriptional regulator
MAVSDTKIISADESFERSRFDMVEFGEQLRRAREAKGMTQQTLAEQLYVTRQAVSRWKCGVSRT